MNINDDAWNITSKELMLLGRIMEGNTQQAFYDCANNLHTLFHVARTYIDTGEIVPPYKVICECEIPDELRE